MAIAGRLAPDTNTEYLLYQTLVGMWPGPTPGHRVDDPPGREWLQQAAGRVEQYMMKAVKEAKVFTSWTDPDPRYEETVSRFVHAILGSNGDPTFLSDVSRFVARIAGAGSWNALARIAVHYTSPGTPDTYQGDELWFRALVDPDNRRAVDFPGRAAMLESLAATPGDLAGLAADPGSDLLKLHVVQSILRMRRAHPALFREGSYEAVDITGARARHAFAFLRRHGGTAALVVVPRLVAGCFGKRGEPLPQAWEDIGLDLPKELRGGRWTHVLTGGETVVEDAVGGIFTPIPVGVLVRG